VTSTARRLGLPALGLLASVLLAAQEPGQFTIIERVDRVLVPFSVMNDGRFVAGLGTAEFRVFEDGREQTIAEFSTEPVPLSAVLMVDSGLRPEALRAVAASRQALAGAFNLTPQHRAVNANDEVAVYRYDNFVSRLLDFTADQDALVASLEWLDNFEGGPGLVGGPSVTETPVVNGVPINPTATTPVTGDRRVLHDAVNEAALALRSRDPDRRKIILIVSDGNERESQVDYEDVQYRLLETEVQVFSIHIRTGLVERLLGNVTSRLDDYADFTGGDVYATGPGNLDPLYARIASQARSQYVLTYTSTNEAAQDRLRYREIEVISRQGYDVSHRSGYYQAP
jgi:VWFA-related protein